MTVESEFSALSAALGASAAGARAYTATASQGLLYMAEVLFNVSGLGFPVVMTVANRAIGAPINIWNDQSDSMAVRDAGWIQLYAADNQAAVDLHPMAFRIAETLSLPVMVCVDGFVLTHAVEPVTLPEQDEVDRFLPTFVPRQLLDPATPRTIGALVGPEAFTEVRYLADLALRQTLDVFDTFAAEYAGLCGRSLSTTTLHGPAGARTTVVALGSVTGTISDVVDARDEVALLGLTVYRPFPRDAVRAALGGCDDVVVIERAFSPGAAAPVTSDVTEALTGTATRVHSVIAGLGGRSVTGTALHRMLDDLAAGRLATPTFLDLREDLVARGTDAPVRVEVTL